MNMKRFLPKPAKTFQVDQLVMTEGDGLARIGEGPVELGGLDGHYMVRYCDGSDQKEYRHESQLKAQ